MAARRGLRDRYTARALVAVAVQIALFVAAVVYGLWSPTLGARVVWPTVAMLPAWAGMAWVTLTRPWDWGGLEPRLPLHRAWGYWEGGVVYGCALGIGWTHADLFHEAKEWAQELHRQPIDALSLVLHTADKTEAWDADTFGYLILSGSPYGWLFVGGALLLFAMAWFLLS